MTTNNSLDPISPLINRQYKLKKILQSGEINSLILNAGPSLTYLTGLHFHLSERPVVCFFIPERDPLIVLPELEKEKLKDIPFTLQAFLYGEDMDTWSSVFSSAIQTSGLKGKRIGVEPRQLRFLEYSLLKAGASGTQFASAESLISQLRMNKDEGEIDAMRKAAEIAEHALIDTLPYFKIGISEKDLAIELTLQLFRSGCDPQAPFSPIVSAGPNSANPHASPTDRKISSGDLLVIDWGANHNGYCSDITRTFAIGKVESEYLDICGVVLNANAAGREVAKPGIAAQVVDQAAREVIDAAGYGQFFTHRTGHGLGMEGHEPPYIRAGNSMQLEPGMAFTIEPGIYLPSRNGVRIEDDVIITDSGIDCLTSLPREAIQLV